MAPPTRILVLCTANQCRSPMAAALLEEHLRSAGIDAIVESAGVLPGGRPAAGNATKVLGRRGIDISGHVSARVMVEQLRDADLVLAMAREHVREAAALDPEALGKTFTLKELVRRAATGPRGTESLGDWLARLSARRSSRDLLGSSPDDDVADPMGGSRRSFAATASELDDLIARLVELAWPPSMAV